MATNSEDTLVTMLKKDRDVLKGYADERGRTMKYILGRMLVREKERVKQLNKDGIPVEQH